MSDITVKIRHRTNRRAFEWAPAFHYEELRYPLNTRP